MGWIPKICIACISYTSCQKTRPISSSRQQRISTKLGMQHHIYLLSLLIISFYILTKFIFMLHVFKRSHNAHIMFIFGHFTVYAYWTLDFFAKKTWNFYFKTRKYFSDEITRLVVNTRLITTLKNVDMFKIIEFYWFIHSAFCGWKRFEVFITCSLEDGFVGGARFSNWQQIQNIAKCKY